MDASFLGSRNVFQRVVRGYNGISFAGVRIVSDVTEIISKIEAGDPAAASELLPIVYTELRRLAAHRLSLEKPGQTLTPTGLVHEAYLRLADVERSHPFNGRGHFYAVAAEAMRKILVDCARRRKSRKRGHGYKRVVFEEEHAAQERHDSRILDIHEALSRLEAIDKSKAELVKLKFFAGFTLEEAAEALGISASTADRYWAFARAWLHNDLGGSQ
jgi:RNA polymerase sigma factor (TIGR02999 family)